MCLDIVGLLNVCMYVCIYVCRQAGRQAGILSLHQEHVQRLNQANITSKGVVDFHCNDSPKRSRDLDHVLKPGNVTWIYEGYPRIHKPHCQPTAVFL